MSPGSKTTKNSKSPEDLLTATPKDTPQKEKKKTLNLLEKKLNDSSYQSIATTSAKPKVKVKAEKASTEVAKIQSAKQNNPVTVKPRSKWLAKREQEMAKQAILLTQKGSNCISGSQQEKQSATLQDQVKGTPQMEGKSASGQTQKLLTGTKLTSMVTTTKFTAPDLLQGPGTEQRLGDIRLGELAAWLAARTPKSPRDAVTMLTRGWTWYYRKYIDVQKGGIGGISMLVAGYCILSYIWSYPHLKRERWRKYH
ncbi:hypothetical protein NFI96_019319 [Prochilodus magdalenae]|nr:hypothetical protein NFI96_019319 [Prochilodus magdalenae]